MTGLYISPVETVNQGPGRQARGPKYFIWRFDPDPPALIQKSCSMMDYGFEPTALIYAHDITQTEHDTLILNSDVYAFPDNLDQPVTDPNIDTFFEGIHLPTNWLTPSTTYRELLRQVAGMIQFNQRYAGLVAEQTGEWRSIFDSITLNDRLRDMTPQEEEWFYQVVEYFGFSRDIVNRNSLLRTLMKQAGNFWADRSFFIGGFEF